MTDPAQTRRLVLVRELRDLCAWKNDGGCLSHGYKKCPTCRAADDIESVWEIGHD